MKWLERRSTNELNSLITVFVIMGIALVVTLIIWALS